MAAGFGIFSPLFEASADYLALLHLDAPEAHRAVAKVVEQCHESSACHEDIGRLFNQPNWRPHLVGAVAISAIPFDLKSCSKLWEAFDGGSWVAPQLAVAAFIRDPTFVDQAGARIRSRCPMNESRNLGVTRIELHDAAGPARVTHRSAKAAASLVHLAGLLPFRPDWLDTELSKPDLIDLLAADIDHADKITQQWFARLKDILN